MYTYCNKHNLYYWTYLSIYALICNIDISPCRLQASPRASSPQPATAVWAPSPPAGSDGRPGRNHKNKKTASKRGLVLKTADMTGLHIGSNWFRGFYIN